MENQPRKRHGNQKVGLAILLLFAMKINDFRGLAGLRIHDNSVEKQWKLWHGKWHPILIEFCCSFDRFWDHFETVSNLSDDRQIYLKILSKSTQAWSNLCFPHWFDLYYQYSNMFRMPWYSNMVQICFLGWPCCGMALEQYKKCCLEHLLRVIVEGKGGLAGPVP